MPTPTAPLRAIILAAGFGRIMDGLIENGIRETAIVTGYRAEELSESLRAAYPAHRFHFIQNARYEETNNIHSLALAFENLPLDQDIILIESDLIYEPAVLTRLLRSPHANVALVDHYRAGMDGTVVSISGGIITSVIPPHLQRDSGAHRRDFEIEPRAQTLRLQEWLTKRP